MTGASLEYSGGYVGTSLNNIGASGSGWSSSVQDANSAYFLYVHIDGLIYTQSISDKSIGRPVRCVSNLAYQSDYATQSAPVALTTAIRLNQACITHI